MLVLFLVTHVIATNHEHGDICAPTSSGKTDFENVYCFSNQRDSSANMNILTCMKIHED